MGIIENIDAFDNTPRFLASKFYGDDLPVGDITSYDTEMFDTTNSFNSDSGVFVAPVMGIYIFQCNAIIRTAEHARIRVYLNGDYRQEFISFEDGSWRTISGLWSFNLEVGDEVKLNVEHESSI